jgi:hypothetical protein
MCGGRWCSKWGLLTLAVAGLGWVETGAAPTGGEAGTRRGGGLFHADRDHVWNRLHRALVIRTAPDDREFGEQELDPLVWPSTRGHLLAGPSFDRAIALLDEFLNEQAHEGVTDPVKRAVLQHDLWGVFDWLARAPAPTDDGGQEQAHRRRQLRLRVSAIVLRVALTPEAIDGLPDTYTDAVESAGFAREYSPSEPERSFLPVGLFDPEGPWIQMVLAAAGRIGLNHETSMGGRSEFLVLVRHPEGRPAGLDHIARWNAWAGYEAQVRRNQSGIFLPRPAVEPEHPRPILPEGTQIALVRRMMAIDTAGRIRPTRLVESVQLRVIDPEAVLEPPLSVGQRFFMFKLDRRALLDGASGPLRAVTHDERGFEFGPIQGVTTGDPFEWLQQMEGEAGAADRSLPPHRTLSTCRSCHQNADLLSLGTGGFSLLGAPRPETLSVQVVPNGAAAATAGWKETQYNYAFLRGLMEPLLEQGR